MSQKGYWLSQVSRILAGMVICCGFFFSACRPSREEPPADSRNEGPRLLLMIARNYGLNYFLNRDEFEQYGWNITHTGVLESISACPPVEEQLKVRPIVPDLQIREIPDLSGYDGVVIMTAAGSFNPVDDSFDDLRKSPAVLRLISEAEREGLAVAAFCSGVRVLAAAGILAGKQVVGAPRFKSEYEAAGAQFLGKDHPPRIDGNLITGARDQYYNILNCQAVATVIEMRSRQIGAKKAAKGPFIFEEKSGLTGKGILWAKTYGGEFADGGRSLLLLPDGGFLITGYSFSLGDGDADILVIKTDDQGKMEWSRTFGGPGTEYGYGGTVVPDGYLITGYTTSMGAGSKDVFLIKLNHKGNEVWSRFYGGSSWDVGRAVCPTEDGGIAVLGFTQSSGEGEEDIYLIKTDADGNLLWSRTYGGKRFELGNSICPTSDGGFLIGATTGTFGSGNSDAYLVKTDSAGNQIWATPYGQHGREGGYDWCRGLLPTSDGGAIAVGHSNANDLLDAYVIKVDRDGKELWSQTFGRKPFYDYATAVVEIPDGYLIGGISKQVTESSGRMVYNNDLYFVELDSQGNVVSEEFLGGPESDWISSMIIADDGSPVLLGHTASFGKGSFDVLLLKYSLKEKS